MRPEKQWEGRKTIRSPGAGDCLQGWFREGSGLKPLPHCSFGSSVWPPARRAATVPHGLCLGSLAQHWREGSGPARAASSWVLRGLCTPPRCSVLADGQ